MYRSDDFSECVKCVRTFLETDFENIIDEFNKLGFEDAIKEYEDKYKMTIWYTNVSIHVYYDKESDVYEFGAWVDIPIDPSKYLECMRGVDEASRVFCEILTGDADAFEDEMIGFTEEADHVKFSMVYQDGRIKNNLPW